MMNILICFTVVSLILTEGSSVKVHPGGNTTLPCNIKDDTEITWIITNGNQTFVRILKLEYVYGTESKPEPSIIHPSYTGRIKALSSPTNTHSLLLMNISDTDLMLYCCTQCRLEQTHCTKLDFEGDVDQQDTDNTKHAMTCRDTLWLPVVSVLLLVSLVSNVCVCWRRKKYRKGNVRSSSKKTHRTSKPVEQGNEADEISYASVNIIKAQKNRERQIAQDTVYARINEK